MNKKSALSVVLIGSIIGETLFSGYRFESAAPQPHIDFEITQPLILSLSAIAAKMVWVTYSSSGFMDKNGGHPGQMTGPIPFSSVHDAMREPFPSGYESAQLWAGEGRYAYNSPRFGWEPC